MKDVYIHEQETWNEAKASKMAKFAPKDAWGNAPPKGLISCASSPYPSYGQTRRYNGGFIAPDDELYEKEHVPLPDIPETFEFIHEPAWGTFIQRKNQ